MFLPYDPCNKPKTNQNKNKLAIIFSVSMIILWRIKLIKDWINSILFSSIVALK